MCKYDVVVVGAGLSGCVAARELAEQGKKVLIIEKRNHIGGNMYDYRDDNGILVHKYGPHTFHTNDKRLYEYICQYEEWDEYKLTCGAVINNKFTPTPFNYQTIDDFFDERDACQIKRNIEKEYPEQSFATVLNMLNSKNEYVKMYAQFLFDNDYRLYTAKQWGVSPREIDPSILSRVPIRFNYDVGYFYDKYQIMPKHSYTMFFNNIIDHVNIDLELGRNALLSFDISEDTIFFENKKYNGILIYTGPIDELFGYIYGRLPYRSLRFEWNTERKKSFQKAAVVAYPQEKGFTRITEYTKLPIQDVGDVTTYAVEYSIPSVDSTRQEPYYPVLTEYSQSIYELYRSKAERVIGLTTCGRLADFKYYNMDQCIQSVLEKIRTKAVV